MDIGSTSALNKYSYLSTLQGSTSNQNAAVLQALTTAYSNTSSGSSLLASDSLSSLAGNAATLPSLVSGIYSASSANGTSSNPFSSLSSATADATSSASLLASVTSSDSSGVPNSAISANANLALAAYTYQQSGMPSTVTAAAKQAVSGLDTTDTAAVQSYVQSIQGSAFKSVMNMLG